MVVGLDPRRRAACSCFCVRMFTLYLSAPLITYLPLPPWYMPPGRSHTTGPVASRDPHPTARRAHYCCCRTAGPTAQPIPTPWYRPRHRGRRYHGRRRRNRTAADHGSDSHRWWRWRRHRSDAARGLTRPRPTISAHAYLAGGSPTLRSAPRCRPATHAHAHAALSSRYGRPPPSDAHARGGGSTPASWPLSFLLDAALRHRRRGSPLAACRRPADADATPARCDARAPLAVRTTHRRRRLAGTFPVPRLRCRRRGHS